MSDLLVEIAPLVLAAAISPATIGIVVLILATADEPLRRALAFTAGFALLLVPLSVVGLLAFSGARSSVDPGSPLFAWIDISMGVVLLVVSGVSLTRASAIEGAQKRLRGAPVAAYFGFGMVMMLSNLNTLAVAVAMLHEIAIADVASFQRGLTLAIVDAVILLPVIAPIALVALAPSAAERVLPKIRAGVDRYGVRVGALVFAAIAVYLLIEGFSHL
jgi:hypothetical protein